MASKNTENTIDGDVLIIKALSKHLRYTVTQTKFLTNLAKTGVIAVETLVEQAISKVGKLKRSNEDGEDFIDGSDAKKATVYYESILTSDRRTAWIGRADKKGVLRCVIADPVANKVFYFKIPQNIRKHFYGNNKSNELTIPFSPNGGKPEKLMQGRGAHYIWNYCLVNSFKELCS